MVAGGHRHSLGIRGGYGVWWMYDSDGWLIAELRRLGGDDWLLKVRDELGNITYDTYTASHDEWARLAVTLAESTKAVKAYINGTERISLTADGDWNTPGSLTLAPSVQTLLGAVRVSDVARTDVTTSYDEQLEWDSDTKFLENWGQDNYV